MILEITIASKGKVRKCYSSQIRSQNWFFLHGNIILWATDFNAYPSLTYLKQTIYIMYKYIL